MNSVFSDKLNSLQNTLELFRNYDEGRLSRAIAESKRRHVFAVGSGGSAVAAEYFSRCRDTVGLGPTTVQTPMQIVLQNAAMTDSEVWLFSAGADNSDATAAVRASFDRNAHRVHLVTRNPDGTAVNIARRYGGIVHVLPVADKKDSYLATHSLFASFVALLLASHATTTSSIDRSYLMHQLEECLANMRSSKTKDSRVSLFREVKRLDTLIIVGDPLLRPTSTLLDTSIWEASLCNVQSADFRNLAHGRHTWLHHRDAETQIIALTGTDSRATWRAIQKHLPETLRWAQEDYGSCGRLENAMALIDGLGIVEAIGSVVGIDPGKPGIAEFGRHIYEDRSLLDLAEDMPPNVRQKRAAVSKSDVNSPPSAQLNASKNKWVKGLVDAEFGGAVFDYDGTIVETTDRWSPPKQALIEQFIRLHDAGLKMGIATGRGGSAGEDLRKVLPLHILASIEIGYYNGGHVRSADVDIKNDMPIADMAISETADWLRKCDEIFIKPEFKQREIQITVEAKNLKQPQNFLRELEDCPTIKKGQVRVTRSGHSYDIVPASSDKTTVVEVIRSKLTNGAEILCFGDSGAYAGNDNALLSQAYGISVDEVCGAVDGCWSLFGTMPKGPDALFKILSALEPVEHGRFRFKIEALGLDTNL